MSTLPRGYRFVQNGEQLRSSDRAAIITADGVTWVPIRWEIIGEQYDEEWPPHPKYAIRLCDEITTYSIGLGDWLRRLGDYVENGYVLPPDPRTQEQRQEHLDRQLLISFNAGVARRIARAGSITSNQGSAGLGGARLGTAGPGAARPGGAGLGSAGPGSVRLGKARGQWPPTTNRGLNR